ncbi:MAG: DUF4179 domain-containing protein [Chloroflexota bacterium]|nr:DUF4179 domain-containing protein [Chloroflexota bacterium]
MTKDFVRLYPDLVSDLDVIGQQLVADLHAVFNAPVPAEVRLAAPPIRHPRPGWALPRPFWPRTALVAVFAIFALAGATAVVLPLLEQLWAGDHGLAYVSRAGLARDLNLTQTVSGVTVQLQRGYADANRVVVGYTVEFPQSTPGGGTPMLGDPTLKDDAGRQYPGLASSFAGGSALGAQVINFAASDTSLVSRDIAFELTIPRILAGGASPSVSQAVTGPWVFRFTLTSASGRAVEPALSATTGDLRLTFTRVVVAPSATRFDYRITSVAAGRDLTGSIGLIVDGKNVSGAGHCERDGRCFFVATESLLERETLTLDEVTIIADVQPTTGTSERNPAQARLKGPFVLVLRP